jgi:hypothetical protein
MMYLRRRLNQNSPPSLTRNKRPLPTGGRERYNHVQVRLRHSRSKEA